MSLEEILPFVYALALGLLIGFERERSHPPESRVGGSRTFALVAVCGALAAFLDPWVIVAGLAGVAALVVVAYRRTSLLDPGTTTEVALLATYLLGALTIDHAPLAVGVAIIITVVLLAKTRIHAFTRDVVTEIEVEDALKFAVIAFVILPLLPNRDMGPYGVLNPHQIWLLVVAFTGISWVGYIAVRVFGDRKGLLLTGLAGGFVSASATTATMGGRARGDEKVGRPIGDAVAGALLATIATFVQLVAIMVVASPEVASELWPACLAGGLVLTGLALLDRRRHRVQDGADAGRSLVAAMDDGDGDGDGDSNGNRNGSGRRTPRPFALRSALVLAAVLVGALLVGRWAAEVFGSSGVYVAAGAAGLADAHAGALASTELYNLDAITLTTALVAIVVAMLANTCTKVVIGFATGGRRFGTRLTIGIVPSMLVFAGAIAVTVSWIGS
jgi:uncharacterized membrane protein (DUF4010 family)